MLRRPVDPAVPMPAAVRRPACWRLLSPNSDAREPVLFCEERWLEAGRYQPAMNSPGTAAIATTT